MNVILIGYRGTGKSSVARNLGTRLHWPWIDADAEVENIAGKTIAAIFAEQGEEVFRDFEVQVAADLLRRDRHVLALGGGVVLRDQNRMLLRCAEGVVWLTAPPDIIAERINADPATTEQRPNLTASGGMQEILDMLALREPLYRECADLQVDTDNKTIEQIADEIFTSLNLST